MFNKNVYGFYSGGYIFDRLDRSALYAIRKRPELKDKQLYTKCADIQFKKQLCDLEDTKVFTSRIDNVGEDEYEIQNVLRKGKMVIAVGCFCFKVAQHNYCETDGGNND